MLAIALLSSFFALSLGDRSVEWKELSCPKATGDSSCSFANNDKANAMAVSFFFQADEGCTGA